jgi:hypothetical protein
MTGPEFSEAEPTPDYAANVAPSDTTPEDFGPDHTAAENSSPFENLTGKARPNPRRGRPPRSTADAFGKLGTNKKARSPVRKLSASDREKIVSLYTFGAMGLMTVRPKAATAMANSAENCADAWVELADQNDNVRRALLAIIEGGVWGKIFAAHMPILLALLPENSLPPMFRGVPDAPPEPTGE